MSGRGGARPGAGRPAGGKNKATIEREVRAAHGIAAAMESGVMPLDVMLQVMRGGDEAEQISDRQFQAAVAAAPYVHAKLNTLKGDPAAPLQHHHTIGDVSQRIRALLEKGRSGVAATG
jgi:hypothetical protein